MKNIFIVILILLTLGAVGTASYFYGKSQGISPSNISNVYNSVVASSSPSASPSGKGIVTGRLCYPASILPAGKIVAKDTTNGQLYSQDYIGSQNGGGSTYTFELPYGTYHMKYDATAPNGVLSGYYTSYSTCVGNPSGTDCSGEKTRPALNVEIKANSMVNDVNICDFYYPAGSPPAF